MTLGGSGTGGRLLALLGALLLAPACGHGKPDDIRLPRLGAVGMSPSGLSPAPVVVTLHPEGRVTLEGRPVSPAGMAQALYPHAEAARNLESPNRESLTWLVLRGDRSVPWSNVRRVLAAAADPVNRICRIVFCARPEEGEEERSFAIFLPEISDRGIFVEMAPGGPRRGNTLEVTIGEAAASRPGDLAALWYLVAPEQRAAPVELSAAPGVPLGRVLRAADVLARVGVRALRVALDGEDAATDWRPAAREPPRVVYRLNGRADAPAGGRVPAVSRRAGLGGFSAHPSNLPPGNFEPRRIGPADPRKWTDR